MCISEKIFLLRLRENLIQKRFIVRSAPKTILFILSSFCIQADKLEYCFYFFASIIPTGCKPT